MSRNLYLSSHHDLTACKYNFNMVTISRKETKYTFTSLYTQQFSIRHFKFVGLNTFFLPFTSTEVYTLTLILRYALYRILLIECIKIFKAVKHHKVNKLSIKKEQDVIYVVQITRIT